MLPTDAVARPFTPPPIPAVNSQVPAEQKSVETNVQTTAEAQNLPKRPLQLLMQNILKFIAEVKTHPGFPQEVPEDKQHELMALTDEVKAFIKSDPNHLDFNKKLVDLEKQYADISGAYEKQRSEIQQALIGCIAEAPEGEGLTSEDKKNAQEAIAQTLLSQMTFDCGGLTRMMEAQISQLKSVIDELKVVANFMKTPENTVRDENKHILLFNVVVSVQRLIKMGVIEMTSS